MSSENSKLWEILGRTDPAHTKEFKRAGGFSGNAIKPIWSYRRMTEEFGPCGYGWGVSEPAFQTVPAGDEILVFCTAHIWFKRDGEEVVSEHVYGVGGDKVLSKNKYGLATDDEAFKKAYTDAITNALKMIGVGADVHMGLFEDSKYVASMRQEFAEPNDNAPEKPKRQKGWRDNGTRTPYSLREEGVFKELQRELSECQTTTAVNQLAFQWSEKIEKDKWPEDWKEYAREEIRARLHVLKNTPAPDDDTFPGDLPPVGQNKYLDAMRGG